LVADDTLIAVNSAAYTNNVGSGPFVATLNINGGVALPAGTYRLFVCGSTSIEDLANNKLNNGLSDAIINFNVTTQIPTPAASSTSTLPKTGFPQDKITALPIQTADKAYAATDLWLEIPKLNLKMSIVGVPQSKDGWDVTWLDKNAGWLNGTAFPTWQGNSVLTAHVWDALNRPGPFARLKELKYGDQVKIHAFGQVFTYELRETTIISPTNTSAMLKHEEQTWLTLITCEDYKELTQQYLNRRMVRAVLVNVTTEK
jgi:LPXTG-site transpeptidase (sortase) family protein